MPGTAAAIDRSSLRISALLLIAFMAHAVGCTRQFPITEVTPIKAGNPAELQRYLLLPQARRSAIQVASGPLPSSSAGPRNPPGFRLTVERGPVPVRGAAKAPLVILLHGHDNAKEDHAFQAMHVASWGMHGMTLQLRSHGPWIANGRTLATLVKAIRQAPEIVDSRVDVNRIILVGHSFGATAVAAALGEGAAASGAASCSIPPESAGNCRRC